MTLPNLRSEQHAQILGFSIIGYGVSFLINLVGPLLNYLAVRDSTEELLSDKSLGPVLAGAKAISDYSAGVAVPAILYGLGMFALCVVTGLIIKDELPGDPKVFGLIFVVLCFGLFPLGTIVSAYALIYLFVIYKNESENSEGAIKLN